MPTGCFRKLQHTAANSEGHTCVHGPLCAQKVSEKTLMSHLQLIMRLCTNGVKTPAKL